LEEHLKCKPTPPTPPTPPNNSCNSEGNIDLEVLETNLNALFCEVRCKRRIEYYLTRLNDEVVVTTISENIPGLCELLELYLCGKYDVILGYGLPFTNPWAAGAVLIKEELLKEQNDLAKCDVLYNALLKYLDIIFKHTESIQNGMNLYNSYIACKDRENILKNDIDYYKDLIHNRDKLIEYLNRYKNPNLFPNVEISVPLVKIKQHIKKYIELYGVPKNGIFDSEKLEILKNELN